MRSVGFFYLDVKSSSFLGKAVARLVAMDALNSEPEEG